MFISNRLLFSDFDLKSNHIGSSNKSTVSRKTFFDN